MRCATVSELRVGGPGESGEHVVYCLVVGVSSEGRGDALKLYVTDLTANALAESEWVARRRAAAGDAWAPFPSGLVMEVVVYYEVHGRLWLQFQRIRDHEFRVSLAAEVLLQLLVVRLVVQTKEYRGGLDGKAVAAQVVFPEMEVGLETETERLHGLCLRLVALPREFVQQYGSGWVQLFPRRLLGSLWYETCGETVVKMEESHHDLLEGGELHFVDETRLLAELRLLAEIRGLLLLDQVTAEQLAQRSVRTQHSSGLEWVQGEVVGMCPLPRFVFVKRYVEEDGEYRLHDPYVRVPVAIVLATGQGFTRVYLETREEVMEWCGIDSVERGYVQGAARIEEWLQRTRGLQVGVQAFSQEVAVGRGSVVRLGVRPKDLAAWHA